MKKSFLLTLLIVICLNAFTQSAKMKSSIGVSIPVVWNHSEATFYGLGSPYYPDGNAISYGLNINYSRALYKGVYGMIGLGYFNQNLKIKRLFRYDSPEQILYSTQSYNYHSMRFLGGIGYKWNISKSIFLNGDITYNQYYSFRQKYIIDKRYNVGQINKKSFSLGEMVNFNFGINRNISERISVGADFLIPIYTHWNKDEIFINSGYSSDEQQIARNKFSAGIVVSCNYNF